MARYKKRPIATPPLPGLFDEFETKGTVDLPVHPSIARHARSVRMSGGARREAFDDEPVVEPVVLNPTDADMEFMAFGSGSSGNCAYVGDDDSGFLVDAGVDADKVIDSLRRWGIGMSRVKGIILTHDHGDHMHYAYNILRKYKHIALYCTPRAFGGMLRRHNVSRRIKDYHRPIYKEIPFAVGNFRITAFEVSHDGTDNSGFFIEHGDQRMAIATDLGCVGERADHYMMQANHLVIEANYDYRMLLEGHYPEYLKARIMADSGHLDNIDTARQVSKIAQAGELRNVWLCHLSRDNNTPDIALSTVRQALLDAGLTVGDGSGSLDTRDAQIQLMALPRFDATQLFRLRKR